MGESSAGLVAHEVSVSFGAVHALRDVSLAVGHSEVVGLIGPNGSGKTTLVNVLSGVRRPASGSVRLDTMEMTRRASRRFSRAGIARTFQNIRLFRELSSVENVEVALRRQQKLSRRRTARALLADHGLTDIADRRAGTLSYAQQRRLEIVRALASEPRFLLLDEPAAGMNRVESGELLEMINAVRDEREIGLLVIDHDLHLIMRLCERIVVLNGGEKIAEGTPAGVQKDPAVVEAYLGAPPPADPAAVSKGAP